MGKRQVIGRWGEQTAAEFLEMEGYSIIDRNVRTPYGEIDLIAQLELPQQRMTVFVEVKTRTNDSYGPPEESVTARKQAHLLAAVEDYMQKHPDPEMAWRVDVIAIRRMAAGEAPQIVHFQNVLGG
jgi:putative endonuclease